MGFRPAWLATLGLALALRAFADDWQGLDGPAITRALERHVLRYSDGSEQEFSYGGLTRYRIGWPNEGRWRVQGDRYCALWPPGESWDCFDVARSADAAHLRFRDASGHDVVADFVKED